MKIFTVGDSTMQFNDYSTYPQVGWAQVFPVFVNKNIQVCNYAKNGRSTKSFIDEGRLDEVSNKIQKGDFLFIQFGHNDEKNADETRYTTPFGTYQENLKKFIDVARNVGAIPVLISSVYRRTFKDGILVENSHKEYPKAMKELALKENILFIDVCEKTKEIISKLGDEKSKAFFMNFSQDTYYYYKDESLDDTHLRYDGAFMVSTIVAEELKKAGEPYSNIICEPIKQTPFFTGGVM